MADPKYRRIEEIQKELLHSLEEQISLRKDLTKQMVGSLYPAIVAGEMRELMLWQDAIRRRG